MKIATSRPHTSTTKMPPMFSIPRPGEMPGLGGISVFWHHQPRCGFNCRDKPLARWSSSFGHLPPSHHFLFRISKRLSSCSLRMARSNSSRYTDPEGKRKVNEGHGTNEEWHFLDYFFFLLLWYAMANVRARHFTTLRPNQQNEDFKPEIKELTMIFQCFTVTAPSSTKKTAYLSFKHQRNGN